MSPIEGTTGIAAHLAFIIDSFGTGEMLAILVLAMVVVGPERLPQTARQIGHAIARMRKSIREMTSEVQDVMDDPAMAPIRELGEFATRPRQKFSEILRDAERSLEAQEVAAGAAVGQNAIAAERQSADALDEEDAHLRDGVEGEDESDRNLDNGPGPFKPVSPGGPAAVSIEMKPGRSATYDSDEEE
jgi:Sec-independent protein translocase protein TatA